jgi:heterodisulfide reductase subunit A-like polyferredoxin/coenzyme F420-reducing hydrogenase delta subunit
MNAQTETAMETIELATDVLVLGGGLTGLKAAMEIAAQGYKVLLAEETADLGVGREVRPLAGYSAKERRQLDALLAMAENNSKIELLADTAFNGAAGIPGDFRIWLYQADELLERKVGAIVVASELRLHPLAEGYGLSLGENVISQSQLEELLADDPNALKGKTVAFGVGFAQAGNPLTMERVFRSAIDLEEIEACTAYIFAGDLKVAAGGLERIYLEGRDKGAIYVKLQEPPQFTAEGGGLKVAYFDQVIRQDVELAPDLIVVEEAIETDALNADLAELLQVDVGPAGFLQTENVHRYPVGSNREGIYVIGGSRAPQGLDLAFVDAQAVALEIKALLGDGTVAAPEGKAVVEIGKCTFCLTCYRCCPHGAIYWDADNKPIVSPVACQACGICASECPMDAIQVGGFADAAMQTRIKTAVAAAPAEAAVSAPKIVAFCCQNSAVEAGEMAELFQMRLPQGLQVVQVPCAGKVDLDYILSAFAEGADGVVVMACHTDNCKSERGNTYASWRVADAKEKLRAVGLAPERLAFATLAANMGSDFAAIVNDMENTLQAMA